MDGIHQAYMNEFDGVVITKPLGVPNGFAEIAGLHHSAVALVAKRLLANIKPWVQPCSWSDAKSARYRIIGRV